MYTQIIHSRLFFVVGAGVIFIIACFLLYWGLIKWSKYDPEEKKREEESRDQTSERFFYSSYEWRKPVKQ